jgi:hypothetical protein
MDLDVAIRVISVLGGVGIAFWAGMTIFELWDRAVEDVGGLNLDDRDERSDIAA